MRVLIGFISGLLFSISSASYANMAGGMNAGDVADTVAGQLPAAADLAIQIFFVIGILLTAAGLLKLKKFNENPNAAPLGLALLMVIVGGLMTVILGIMQIPPDTFFGA